MELLQKSIITIDNTSIKPIYNLQISDELPEYLLDNKIYQILNKYKNMINNIDNIKIWDFCKKLSNEYELLHHCIKIRSLILELLIMIQVDLFLKCGSYVLIVI